MATVFVHGTTQFANAVRALINEDSEHWSLLYPEKEDETHMLFNEVLMRGIDLIRTEYSSVDEVMENTYLCAISVVGVRDTVYYTPMTNFWEMVPPDFKMYKEYKFV